jgi:hypothetical protein
LKRYELFIRRIHRYACKTLQLGELHDVGAIGIHFINVRILTIRAR